MSYFFVVGQYLMTEINRHLVHGFIHILIQNFRQHFRATLRKKKVGHFKNKVLQLREKSCNFYENELQIHRVVS